MHVRRLPIEGRADSSRATRAAPPLAAAATTATTPRGPVTSALRPTTAPTIIMPERKDDRNRSTRSLSAAKAAAAGTGAAAAGKWLGSSWTIVRLLLMVVEVTAGKRAGGRAGKRSTVWLGY